MKRRPHLFLTISGACVLAMGLAVGCRPGEVGETDGGTTGTGSTSGTAGDSGNAGTSGGGGSNAGAAGAVGASGASGTAGAGGTGSGGSGAGSGGGGAGQGGLTAGGAGGAAGRGGTGGGTTGAAGRGGAGGGAGGAAGRGGSSAGGSGGTTGAAGRGGAGGSAGGGTTGAAGRGGAGGTAGTGAGGSGPTQCTLQNHSGNGSFTWYNFAQGTARDGNGYRTACGYYGTANGTTDTVENIASTSPAAATYFAAIPGNNGFDSKSHCGECVQITGQNGTMIIATVIDECPYGSDGGNTACQANAAGHLDLSKTAFDRLGYPVGNPSNTNWKFVPCPVSGNVKVRFKSGNNNEFFVENIITPIASVTINGMTASRQSYGAWHVGPAITTPATLNLTDMAGRSITVTLNGGTSNQDTGVQFPTCL